MQGQTPAAVAAGMAGAFVLLRREEQAEKRRRTTLAEMSAQAERFVCERRRLAEERALTDCLAAVRSFDLGDLGQGHAREGNAAHRRNRFAVLDRIRMRSPLPPALDNDWTRFKCLWDRQQVAFLGGAANSWGVRFRDIAAKLLEKIQGGEADVLAQWMKRQSRNLPDASLVL